MQRIEVSSVGPYTESRLEPTHPEDLEPINQPLTEEQEADLNHYFDVFFFGSGGERSPGVNPGDCDWLYTADDFEF